MPVENTPDVSVIIVNRNGAVYLPECLGALWAQQLPPLEILILDNASTDDSLQVIETFQAQNPGMAGASSQAVPTIRVVENAHNLGFGCANNQGIHMTAGDYVLLLNADVVLDRRFLSRLIDTMRRDKTIGIAAGKLLNYADRRRIDSTGLVMHKNRRAYDRGQAEIDTGRYEQEEEVFGASGAACLCRRSMLEDLRYGDEYFDALFFAYKGDIDLSWRARLFGWKCVYTPDAIGWHHRQWGMGKRRDIPRWVRRHSFKNRYLMLLKNDRWQTLRPGLGAFIGFEAVSLVYVLFREPYLLLALGDILRAWPVVMKKRRHIQQIARQRQQIDAIRKWFE